MSDERRLGRREFRNPAPAVRRLPVKRVPIDGELDLHAFAPRDIPSVVEEYVDAAWNAGLHRVRLVHGRGRGVQRGIVQATLDRHRRVAEFWDDTDSHLGATVARLIDQ